MPLILISGYPSSGKTYRSEQLIADFNTRISSSEDPRISRLKIQLINDQSLGLSRDAYANARSEKDARAAFSSAIKREIGSETIVIADGMNYIKGFRYQMYCEAKAVRTMSCVVHIGTPIDTCRTFNATALDDKTGGYESSLFENLVFRYEEPNGMTRWDSPLFTVPYDDPSPPTEAIWNALVGTPGNAPVVKPNAATVLKAPTQANYLYELDRTTSDIVNKIVAWQRDHADEGGGSVAVEGTEREIELPGTGAVGLPQLQRLRRQFVTMNRTHEIRMERVKDLFVEYLNDAFQK